MASYHLRVKSVSRSDGRSATAAAAYRAGARIACERGGKVHDYRRRRCVAEAHILLPQGAPPWAMDRERLWNAAEAAEKRKNSVVAREWEIALPHELAPEARAALAAEFAQALAERYGVAVDMAVHEPHPEGDERNHHAHLLATTRRMGAEGLGEKTRLLDVAATSGPEVEAMRALWAEMQNRALERAEAADRVDHRTLEARRAEAEAQGRGPEAAILTREPEGHMGKAAVALERKAEAARLRTGAPYVPATDRAADVAEARRGRGQIGPRLGLRQRPQERALERFLVSTTSTMPEGSDPLQRPANRVFEAIAQGGRKNALSLEEMERLMAQILAMEEEHQSQEAEALRRVEERRHREEEAKAEAARKAQKAARMEIMAQELARRFEADAEALPRAAPEAIAKAAAREREAEEAAARVSLGAAMALQDHLAKAPEGLSGLLRGLVGLNFLWRRGKARLEAAQDIERAKLMAATRQREAAEQRERQRLEEAERRAAPERGRLEGLAALWRYGARQSADEALSAAMERGDGTGAALRLEALCDAESRRRAGEPPAQPQDEAARDHEAFALHLARRRAAEKAQRLSRERAEREEAKAAKRAAARAASPDKGRGYGE